MTGEKEHWIGDVWRRQLRDDVQRRLDEAKRVAALATRPDFKAACDDMVRVHEGIVTAVALDGNVPSVFVVNAADRLAGEVCRLVDDHVLDPRSAAGDALIDYASIRHGGGDFIAKVRETYNDLPTTTVTPELRERPQITDDEVRRVLSAYYSKEAAEVFGDWTYSEMTRMRRALEMFALGPGSVHPVSVAAETPV